MYGIVVKTSPTSNPIFVYDYDSEGVFATDAGMSEPPRWNHDLALADQRLMVYSIDDTTEYVDQVADATAVYPAYWKQWKRLWGEPPGSNPHNEFTSALQDLYALNDKDIWVTYPFDNAGGQYREDGVLTAQSVPPVNVQYDPHRDPKDLSWRTMMQLPDNNLGVVSMAGVTLIDPASGYPNFTANVYYGVVTTPGGSVE